MTNDPYANAVADIAEVFMFEHWLRHSFVVEKDGKLFLEVSQDDLRDIYQQEEHLAPLVDMLQNAEISYEKCQATVCSFVGARYDGTKYGPDVVARALDSKAFKIEMYVFGVWLKGHQQYLDERRMSFAEWREMYAGWNSLDQVKEYRKKLMAGGGDPDQPSSRSVH
ncbi:hypothetical protein SAMN04488503_2197 [Humidesulfovibrio mexicanus]|uniref:Uncharacterized protein n=1 Tax=Humidesulfovibrio mexicanus TaxID=147047 RepID=A0A239ASQ4_9BACT|nr:hypothetical protein [Humidesulfovibrio mexicanus]SNR98657.1 hypothetical protein SAMN04488503_2197 [Humidesulfovibrio mexicanus]